MVIIACIIWGIMLEGWYCRKNGEKFSYKDCIKSVGCNVIFSLIIYSYYFGYSLYSYKSAFTQLTMNAAGFLVISFVCAVLQLIYKQNKDRLIFRNRKGIKRYTDTKKEIVVLSLILLLALSLRIIGFNWGGDGFTFQPDESKVWHWAMLMAGDNTFMSGQINYPSHTSHKILSVIYKIYHLFCFILGKEYTNINCLYVARIYMAVVGTGVTACVYFIGRKFSKNAGVIAAILTALFPPFISAGYNITGDSLMALCFCLAILAAMHYWEETETFRSYQWIGAMSLLAAAATLEKYHGAIICVLIAIVILGKNYEDRRSYFARVFREGMTAALLYIVFFALISPNLLIRLNEVYDQLFKLTNDYESGATATGNLKSYIMWFFSHAGVLSLLPIGYAVWLLLKRKDKRILLLGTGVIELIVIITQNRAYIRWVYPFYLSLILFVGIGLSEMRATLALRKARVGRFAVTALMLLMVTNYFLGAVVTVLLYNKNNLDTRNMAEKWFLDQGIEISDCIYDAYTCWNPGGLSKYSADVESIESSIEQVEGRWFVNRLGRKYAVNNASRYPLEINGSLSLSREFTVDYGQSKNSFAMYSDYSNKIYEVYSIWDSVRCIKNLLNDDICTGENLVIYDISDMAAFQEFMMSDFTINAEGVEQTEYILSIPRLLTGEYEVRMDEIGNENTLISVRFGDGSEIVCSKTESDKLSFTLQEDCSDVRVSVISDGTFDKMVIIRK